MDPLTTQLPVVVKALTLAVISHGWLYFSYSSKMIHSECLVFQGLTNDFGSMLHFRPELKFDNQTNVDGIND